MNLSVYLMIGCINGVLTLLYNMTRKNGDFPSFYNASSFGLKLFAYIADVILWPLSVATTLYSKFIR